MFTDTAAIQPFTCSGISYSGDHDMCDKAVDSTAVQCDMIVSVVPAALALTACDSCVGLEMVLSSVARARAASLALISLVRTACTCAVLSYDKRRAKYKLVCGCDERACLCDTYLEIFLHVCKLKRRSTRERINATLVDIQSIQSTQSLCYLLPVAWWCAL